MNKADFIKELDKRLKYIPKEDREDAVEYYTELISDMELDDAADVSERLGTPKEAAKKIIDECTEKHVQAYEEKKTVKGNAMVVWLTIIGLLSLPVSLPLAIVVLALAFAVIVVALSVLISLIATAVSLVLSGIMCLVVMWLAPGIAEKAIVFGMGLFSLALGTLACFGLFYLIRWMIRKIFRRDGRKVKENEE